MPHSIKITVYVMFTSKLLCVLFPEENTKVSWNTWQKS